MKAGGERAYERKEHNSELAYLRTQSGIVATAYLRRVTIRAGILYMLCPFIATCLPNVCR